MKRVRWLVALLLGLGWQADLQAQVLIGPAPGVGFHYHGRRFAFSGFIPYGYGLPYYPYYASPYSSVTYIYSPPPVVMPPIVINNNIHIDRGGPAQMQVDREDDGQFLKIIPRVRRPDEGPRNVPPPDPDRARPRPDPAPKPPAPKAEQPKPAPRPAPPKDLVDEAKEAFAQEQYGLAERRLQRAIQANPRDPLAHFLLAQAQFALGKYREAVDAIHDGMRLRVDWPLVKFDPRQLYGDDDESFPDHLKRLDDTLARHPNDPTLLFLRGYELWFTGKQDEGRALFQRAARLAPDTTFIDRFLKAKLAGLPVVQR